MDYQSMLQDPHKFLHEGEYGFNLTEEAIDIISEEAFIIASELGEQSDRSQERIEGTLIRRLLARAGKCGPTHVQG